MIGYPVRKEKKKKEYHFVYESEDKFITSVIDGDEGFSGEDETDETDEEWTPLQRFLVANNLTSIQNILEAEQIDLEALMLLTDADIAALKLPLGPRRKLTNAITDRKEALAAPEKIIKDTRL